MLGPDRLAVLGQDDIGVIDLDARREFRLKLPETDDRDRPTLADGGLGTLAEEPDDHATIVVYAEP
jgi:hypothetical protein